MATRKKDSGAASPFRSGFDSRMLNRSIASCPYQGDEAEAWRKGFAAACQHMDAPVPGWGPDETIARMPRKKPDLLPSGQERREAEKEKP